ncbi:MAG: DUF2254 domain-containing protein, partial [Polyangiaceae bacterium]|nr:DUF2254 domain-containing protein [Polyangiaceae bacterium]
MRLRNRWRTARAGTFKERLKTSLWLAPLLGVVGALGLLAVTTGIDRSLSPEARPWFAFRGAPDSARALLSTMGAALLTLMGVVFSVTILVLQLASTQYSSRTLRTFLEDGTTRFTLGSFVSSFVFALLVLSQVRESRDETAAYVPGVSVYASFALTLVCVAAFVRYIDHMAHSIRAVHVIARVADEARRAVERVCPEGVEVATVPALPDGPPDRCVSNDHLAGILTHVNEKGLLAWATARDVVVHVLPSIGAFVPKGAPLLAVWGQNEVEPSEVRSFLGLGAERTPDQDPAFGLRQLVDIAERALSPGVNDPTTAVQALDQIHDLLRALAPRSLPAPLLLVHGGRARVAIERPGWSSYVEVAFEEIRQYGCGSVQVVRRMRGALDDLIRVA